MKSLLEKISYNDGEFPRRELEEIISRKEEAIPELLNILQDVSDHPEKYSEQPNYFGHIYAFYLLAQFRVKELNPLFFRILKMPGEMLEQLLGDFLTEAGGRVIATNYDGNIEPLKEMIEDEKVYSYARGQFVSALTILVLNNQIEREVVIDYYQTLLRGKSLIQDVFTEVVICCDRLYPVEVYEDIKSAYRNDLIDSWMINLGDIERTLAQSKEEVLSKNTHGYDRLIENTIEELENWHCFHQKDKRGAGNQLEKMFSSEKALTFRSTNKPIVNEVQIGRNDPCICGSGKKYKKCCGK